MAEKIRLYHGTSSVFKDEISKYGLIPHNETNLNAWLWKRNDSGLVFLTTSISIAFGLSFGAVNRYGGSPMVVEVYADRDNLTGDNGKTYEESMSRWETCAYIGRIEKIERILRGKSAILKEAELQRKAG